MRTGEKDWQSMTLVECHHFLARVIGSIVLEDDRGAPPARLLLVQQFDQGGVEELHHGAVGIGLHEG